MINNTKIVSALLFLFIVLSPIQDFVLAGYGFGIFGASPSFIPLTILILIGFFNGKNKKMNIFTIMFILYAATVFIVAIYSYDNFSEIENSALKSAKVFILYLYFFYPIFFLKYDQNYIRYAIFIAFVISILGLLASCIYPESFDTIQSIHLVNQTNLRPRGFATESTTLSIQIITLGFLCAIFSKNKFAKNIFLSCILISLLLVESKGGIVAISLAIFISVLFFFKASIKLKILAVAMSLSTLFFAYNFLFGLFIDDFNHYTSSATRLIMALATFSIFGNHPFGVGVAGYLQEISNNIPIAIKFINFPLNFEEVNSYINPDSYYNVSAKSLFFNGCIYLGVPFFICYIYFFNILFRKILKTKNLLLMILLVFSCIALTFYADGIAAYSLPIALGIAFGLSGKKSVISSIKEK